MSEVIESTEIGMSEETHEISGVSDEERNVELSEDHQTDNFESEDHQTDNVESEDHQTDNVESEDHQTDNVESEDHQTDDVSSEDHQNDAKSEDHLTDDVKSDHQTEDENVTSDEGAVGSDDATTVKQAEPESDLESPDDQMELNDELPDARHKLKEASRLMELEEVPGDEDVTAEELELNAPLEQWVSDLIPSMRELLAPELFHSDESQHDDHMDQESCAVPEVLLSDSPMMQRFQATLRAHLIRQKEKLENDVFDMELGCNKKNKEIKEMGLTINKEQEHLIKQKDMIDKYKSGICEVTNKRKQFDNALNTKTKDLKETEIAYNEAQKEDKMLFQQFNEMTELLYRLTEMEKTQNEELKFAKNLSDKQKQERIKMAQEKQKQDLYIWKLSQELERINFETKTLIEQTELKKTEISDLTNLITDIEADTDGLRKENNMIICASQHLVQEIKRRDKNYKDSEDKVERAQSELSLLLARLRSYNKSIKSEEDRKSVALSSKNKLDVFIQRGQKYNQTLVMRYEESLEKLAQVQNMVDSLENDEGTKNADKAETMARMRSLTSEIDDLNLRKLSTKSRYDSVMSNMKIQSTMSKKLQKSIEELSHENQDIGLKKLEIECKIGELMTEIEQSKVKKAQLEVKIDNLKNTIRDKESELKTIQVQRKKLHQQIQGYKSKVIGATKRLENLLKFNDDSFGQGLLVRRYNTLLSEMTNIDEKISDVKQNWMNIQNALIEYTYKLSQLEATTNTIRKHLFLTKYKKDKLEGKISELENEKKKTDKEFTLFHNKLTTMTLENFRHEQVKDKLSDSAKESETKFVTVLKDAEEVAYKLQNEICEMEDINFEMSEEITKLQREFLVWEKKWKMAVEARERLEKERASTGELGAMKLEIHRMEVRYSQLKKAQEKLTQDLEMCIAKRDNIMDLAHAKERKGSLKASSYSRDQFNKKLDSIKQKIKQIQNALKHSDKEIQELEGRKEELMGEYIKKQKHLTEVKLGVDKLETEIQEGQLHKYKSLELVVRRQRKIRLLDDLKQNRYRLYCKSETNVPLEEEKQEMIGCNLVEVLQSLLSDFPKLKLQLLQIYNTVTTPVD